MILKAASEAMEGGGRSEGWGVGRRQKRGFHAAPVNAEVYVLNIRNRLQEQVVQTETNLINRHIKLGESVRGTGLRKVARAMREVFLSSDCTLPEEIKQIHK